MMLVLATVVVASVLGMSYLTVTSVQVAGSTNLLRASRARYLAESGLHHGLYLLRTDSPVLAGHGSGNPLGPYYADGSDDPYFLYTRGITPTEHEVTGTATCRGLTRTTQSHVQVFSRYRDEAMALGPMHYWRLGELSGDTARDETNGKDGRYREGVALGKTGAIFGDLDRAAGFDGVNDYVTLSKDVDVPGQNMTLVAWFRADDFALTDGRIISKANGLNDNDHYWMISPVRVDADIRLRFRLKAGGLTSTLVASEGNLQPNQWVMAVATYDGVRMKLYKDAVQVGERIKFGLININGGVVTWIGGNPSGKEDRPFRGTIDEVAIFNKTLTPDQIETLYKARIGSIRILSWDK